MFGGGFFRTLDRRAAMRAATRRHSGKGRAVPERCPSISVLLRSTRLRACVRVRCSEIEISHRVLRARQPAGRGVMRASCAMEFAARLICCSACGPSARMHPASQGGHGPVAPALFIVRRDELLSVRTSKGGSVCGRPLYSLPWSSVHALRPTETRHSPRNPVMARPRTPCCWTTSSNAPCSPCRTPVAMGAKTFLNSARSAQGEVLPAPVRMACSSRVQRRRCKHR